MKNIIKALVGLVISVTPAIISVKLLFFKLAPYVASCIPFSPYHKLFSIVAYVAIAYFGGLAAVILSLMLGITVASIIVSLMD